MKRKKEVFESEILDREGRIRENKQSRLWIIIFFSSLILCGNGRSVSLITYIGGSTAIIIIVYLIGFIAMLMYLNGLFSQKKGIGASIIIDSKNISIGNENILLKHPIKITVNQSPTYYEVDLEKLGNNWLEYYVNEKFFKVEFYIKGKKHENVLRERIKELNITIN